MKMKRKERENELIVKGEEAERRRECGGKRRGQGQEREGTLDLNIFIAGKGALGSQYTST